MHPRASPPEVSRRIRRTHTPGDEPQRSCCPDPRLTATRSVQTRVPGQGLCGIVGIDFGPQKRTPRNPRKTPKNKTYPESGPMRPAKIYIV
jgi:hypothetical protein